MLVAAQLAAGTGSAQDAADSDSETPATATGSGAALDARVQITFSVGAASGSGSAASSAGSILAQASRAAATGSASGASIIDLATVSAALGSGVALDAAVVLGALVYAQAELASASGEAFDPDTLEESTYIPPPAIIGGAHMPVRRPKPMVDKLVRPIVVPAPEVPSPYVVVGARPALGTGEAYDASVVWDDDEFAIALLLSVA